MKIRFAFATLILASLLASTAHAQNPIRIVTVSGGESHGDFENQVGAAVKARISATTRYVLGDVAAAELEVSVVCFDISTLARRIEGGICSFSVYYWPRELAGLSCLLGNTTMFSGSETSHIGERIFEAVIEASTEKELAEHLSSMKRSIALYESNKNSSKP